MQKMHWCSAKVNLAGKNLTIVVFDATNPISWPEAQVIMVLHGEENIFEIKPVAVSETTIVNEDQPTADDEGKPLLIAAPHANGEDDDDGDDPPIGDPPPGAVFKPGRARPPAKGA